MDPRSAVVAAALAACGVGLVGLDAGLLWLVAGVWTVRAVAGLPLGFAWGLACATAGLAWGTLSLGDVGAGARLVGPTLMAGSPVWQAGAALALVAALADEARGAGLRSRSWGVRGAAVAAVVALPVLFIVPGPSDPGSLVPVWWVLATAGCSALVLLGTPLAQRLPGWAPAGAAVAGLVAMSVAA